MGGGLSKLGFSDEIRLVQQDLNFLEFHKKDFCKEEQDILEIADDKLDKPRWATIALGFSMVFSLRRYIPSFRRGITIQRCVAEIFTFSIPAYISYVGYMVPMYLKDTNEVRKNLVMRNDRKFLAHKKDQWTENKKFYKTELRLFREIMDREEFLEWYTDVPQYTFDDDQQPNISEIELEANVGELPYEVDENQKAVNRRKEIVEKYRNIKNTQEEQEGKQEE